MAETRIGAYICNCGTNIAKVVDCEAICKKIAEMPNVVVARTYKYMCSNPGQDMIVEDIREHNLNRVIVAACSPRMHERTFRKALQTAGINPYFFEMANIREQCSWVHDNREAATAKAEAVTRAAILRVAHHEPLEKLYVDMCPATLVLGGGIAGLSAALELADAGHPVYLVEKSERLGGNLARVDLTAPHLYSARDLLSDRITRVHKNPNVQVILESELKNLSGYVGNFTALIGPANGSAKAPKERSVDVGSVVVCTGYKEFDAGRVTHYGYGKLPNVITSFEFEKMLREGKIQTKEGRIPQYFAIVHCGSVPRLLVQRRS